MSPAPVFALVDAAAREPAMFCIDRASFFYAYGHQFVVAVGAGVGFFLVVRVVHALVEVVSNFYRKVRSHA